MAPHRTTLTFSILLCSLFITLSWCTSADVLEEQKITKFLSWFEESGGVAKNISLRLFDGNYGIGIVAKGVVHEGDTILDVPLHLVICRDTILKTVKDSQARVTFGSIRSDEDMVSLFLLYEKFLGTRSKWHPYIEVLPKKVLVTSMWKEEELQLLQDDRGISYSSSRRRLISQKYRSLLPLMNTIFNQTMTDIATINPNHPIPTEEEFQWAVSLTGSRALTLQGRKYLVPFADMVNYEPHSRQREAAAGAYFLAYHQLGANQFKVKADRDCFPNFQLFEDYGDNDNSLYLHHHGFVSESNPFDCVHVQLPTMSVSPSRSRILKELDLSNGFESCIRIDPFRSLKILESSTFHVPQDVLTYIRISLLNSTELSSCDKMESIDDCLSMNKETVQFSIYRKLLKIVKKMTSDFESRIKDDEIELMKISYRLQDFRYSMLLSSLNETYLESQKEEHIKEFQSNPISSVERESLQTSQLAVQYRLLRKKMLDGIYKHLSQQGKKLNSAAKKNKPVKSIKAQVEASDNATPNNRSTGIEEEGNVELANSVSNIPTSISANNNSSRHITNSLSRAALQLNEWLQKALKDSTLMKIEARYVNPHMRLGAFVVSDVLKAETSYLTVPISHVMDASKASNSTSSPILASVFSSLKKRFPRGDRFHELLLYLLFEKCIMLEESFFFPYLATLPTKVDMHIPLFYNQTQLSILEGSPILPKVIQYRSEVQRKFTRIQTHIFNMYPELFTVDVFNYDNYMWAHAILDSRAIWWDNERHLVPLLDLVNCADEPPQESDGTRHPPMRAHATRTNLNGADTKAPINFKKNDQILENYAQPNNIYFQYHGFSLEQNSNDCIIIQLLPLSVSNEMASARFEYSSQPSSELCVPTKALDEDSIKFIFYRANRIVDAKRIEAASGEMTQGDRDAVGYVMVGLADVSLKQFPSTLESDRERIQLELSNNADASTLSALEFITRQKMGLIEIKRLYSKQ